MSHKWKHPSLTTNHTLSPGKGHMQVLFVCLNGSNPLTMSNPRNVETPPLFELSAIPAKN